MEQEEMRVPHPPHKQPLHHFSYTTSSLKRQCATHAPCGQLQRDFGRLRQAHAAADARHDGRHVPAAADADDLRRGIRQELSCGCDGQRALRPYRAHV